MTTPLLEQTIAERRNFAISYIQSKTLTTRGFADFVGEYSHYTDDDGFEFQPLLPVIPDPTKAKPKGSKADLTLDEYIEFVRTGQVENGWRDKKEEYGGVAWQSPIIKEIKNKYKGDLDAYEKAHPEMLIEIRPKFFNLKNLFIIDVDCWKRKVKPLDKNKVAVDINIQDVLEGNFLPESIREKSPFLLSRTKALPHFLIQIPDVPEEVKSKLGNANACGIFKDFDGDLLYNHAWEKPKQEIYNYTENGIPEVSWNTIQKMMKPKSELPKAKRYLRNTTSDEGDDDTSVETSSLPNSVSDEKLEQILELSECFAPDLLDSRENWNIFTWAIQNICGEGGQGVWDTISARFQNYDKVKNFQKWQELAKVNKSKGKKVGMGRLREWAKDGNSKRANEVIGNDDESEPDWDRLEDRELARLFYLICFNNKLVYTGKASKPRGYLFNGVSWIDLGENDCLVAKGSFDKLYNYLVKKLSENKWIDENDKKSINDRIIHFTDSATGRSNIIKILKMEHYKEKIEWNINPNLIAFDDAVYDLENAKWVRPTPEMFINVTCGYSIGITWDKNGTPSVPLFEDELKLVNDTINSIFENNVVNYVWAVLASLLRQGNVEQKAYFFLGGGRNGKGILVGMLQNALGLNSYFGELDIGFFTKYSKGEHSPNVNLANCRNARVVSISEIGQGEGTGRPVKFLEDKFKRATGGDIISTRYLFDNTEIQFRMGTPIFQTNLMCELQGIEDPKNRALRDRPVIVPFVYTFVEENEVGANPYYKKKDYYLVDKLNAPNVRKAFILELFNRYKDFKPFLANPPAEVLREKAKYFSDSDQIGKWIESDLVKSENPDERLCAEQILTSIYGFGCKLAKAKIWSDLENRLGKVSVNADKCGVGRSQGHYYIKGYTWKEKTPGAVL